MLYGAKLKDLRKYEDIKQTELVKIIGISSAAYSEFEREKTIIPLKHLINICNYFNVSLDYIFSFTENKQYTQVNNNLNLKLAGERLKEIRKINKLTQEELAKIINTTHSMISDYENGKLLISTTYLYNICYKYNISADYLLGRIDYPKNFK